MRVPFGKYQLIATLGRGGMADVYLAAIAGPVGFRKLVVIKRIRDDVPDREQYTAMLLEEGALAARLQHPNVVQTFEVGVHEAQHYIAMEFLEGQSIAKILQVGGRPDPAFSVRVITDALAGLEYAHTLADYDGRPLNIVHRDVSPQNLFVTYAGEVKVVDFGVAKTATQGAGHTAVGVIKGKLGYMAPEQLNQEPLDRRTDVWAAGIVLWELLTGRRLFKGASEVEGIAKILHDPIPRPSSLFPDIPPVVEGICLRALQRDPAMRWQSAGEMREALYRYMESPGGEAFRRDDVGRHLDSIFAKDRQDVRARVTEFMAEADAAGTEVPTTIESLRSLRPSGPHDQPITARDRTPASLSTPPQQHSQRSLRPMNPPTPPVSIRPPASTNRAAPAPPPKKGAQLNIGLAALAAASVLGASAAVIVRLRHAENVTQVREAGAPIAAAVPPPMLVLEGSGTLGVEMIPALVDGFLKKRGASAVRREKGTAPDDVFVVGTTNGVDESILVRSTGTSRAFACLGDRSCDIGLAAREIRPDEVTELAGKGIGDMHSPASEHVVALDGIAVVVSPASPVRSLELRQVQSIFTGDTRDWSAVGGPAGPVHVTAFEHGSGTLDAFGAMALGGRPLAAEAKPLKESTDIADAVASDPNGIGFVGMSFVRRARALAIGDKNVVPMFPSAFTVSTEKYLLARRVYFYTAATPKPLARDFVDYVMSENSEAAIRAAGFTDLGVSLKSAEPCTSCSARYAAVTKHGRRLSVDFRFRPGTHDLDARAARDIDRVIRFFREHPTDKILLLGFSDASGDPRADKKRSRELAQAVDAELAARGLRASVIEGFGSDMPVAQSGSDFGRAKNRRVEIWLEEH